MASLQQDRDCSCGSVVTAVAALGYVQEQPGGVGAACSWSCVASSSSTWMSRVPRALPKQASQQIVETEHLLKCLLEQPNGLARRILAKAGSNPSQLLEKTDDFIRRQPRVSGDSQQARAALFSRLGTIVSGTVLAQGPEQTLAGLPPSYTANDEGVNNQWPNIAGWLIYLSPLG